MDPLFIFVVYTEAMCWNPFHFPIKFLILKKLFSTSLFYYVYALHVKLLSK